MPFSRTASAKCSAYYTDTAIQYNVSPSIVKKTFTYVEMFTFQTEITQLLHSAINTSHHKRSFRLRRHRHCQQQCWNNKHPFHNQNLKIQT